MSVECDDSGASSLERSTAPQAAQGGRRGGACLAARTVRHRPWTCCFVAAELTLVAAWAANVVGDSLLILVGGLAMVITALVIMGSSQPLAMPQPLRYATACAIIASALAITSSPWLMGGLDTCAATLELADFEGLGPDAGESMVYIGVELSCFWVISAAAAYCMAMAGALSLYRARTVWSLVLTWAAVAVDLQAWLVFMCSGRRSDQMRPAEDLLFGAANFGLICMILLIWLLLLQRLQTLETALPEHFDTRKVRVILRLGCLIGAGAFAANNLALYKVNAAMDVAGGLVVCAVGSITAAGLHKMVHKGSLEAQSSGGLKRKEILWAAHVFRIELFSVLVTSSSTALHLFWRAHLNWTWSLEFPGASYLLTDDSPGRAVLAGDSMCNAISLAMMCGAFSRSYPVSKPAPPSREGSQSSAGSWDSGADIAVTTVVDLAHRGVRLADLIDLYAQLAGPRSVMPSFDPCRSTTNDVVREAIIPLSRHADGSGGTSLATKWNASEPRLAERMVTHSWSNIFTHLVAAIIADGLGSSHYEEVVTDLLAGRIRELRDRLRSRSALDTAYWVCAVCINQHAGICGGFGPAPDDPLKLQDWERQRRNSVSREPYPVCFCRQPKHFNDHPDECELNKFDEMMAYLSYSNSGFRQVIAVDCHFSLFTRAWCIAEIVEAQLSAIKQTLIAHSQGSVDDHYKQLRNLDIRQCEASRREDKDAILGKIEDIDRFNECVYILIFGEGGLFSQWVDRESKLQSAGRVVARLLSHRERATTV